ncbi:ATP-binding protein [Burkholderia cepacia]|uniref:histidine kinase n=1 Tax=Burkholderia cepacia TaxID=292 RepID=A0ABM6P6A6_BURCE|nr:ATP-binding protein [Burkholderia cepacia]AIO28417.1 histidine kinase-, DNA gyrase B-, and HSP90-like ATPase family protein [Burkholderia cepacia ATCC 25416]ALK20920.1 histidine kinase [Burkholderia cepacia ATCC 25416]ASE99011.1 CHASE2 domain-containing protein [Burkholderia cepacia]ATF82722.1 histidine kinase [Burkholderia cepacia]MCA8469171.1 CHASE2 and HATPase_c domain-containing protein [Burkholderia cepacia]
MLDRLRQVPGIAASARPSTWLLLTGVAALAALSCTAAVETLLSPVDRLYWHAVSSGIDRGPRDKVAVIMVDKKTLAELGGSGSYTRTAYAGVLDRVAGASSVVLDMTMISPAQDDGVLAAAIARHGRVVLPAQMSPVHDRADTVILPARSLREAAAAIGQRSIVLGSDHLVQGIVPYVKSSSGDEIPHVGLQAIRVANVPLPDSDVRRHVQPHVTRMGRVEDGTILLGLPLRFDLASYSFVDVLKGRVPASAWRDRIVFIGDGMSEMTGVFYLSTRSGGRVKRVEVDALATEALLDGHLMRRVPAGIQLVVSMAVAIGMLLICLLVPGRRMYGFALAWLAAYVAGETALLVYGAYWTPVGPSLAVCVTIFAVCGWRRAGSLRAALMKEYRGLRGLAGRHTFAGLAQTGDADDAAPTDDDVAQAMSRIREWQSTYVDVIHTLPYPIFVEQDGSLLMCNERGNAMLKSIDVDSDAAARQVIGIAYDKILAAKKTGRIHSAELTLNARTHMMMVTPFGDGDRHRSTASMICLVDIHNITAAVESDRMTLRHMAHDLRNPLSTVLSLLEQHSVSNGSTDPDFLADLHRLVDYSLRVAQDFTQLSRAEHLDQGAYIPVSASDLAMEAVDQVWHSAGAKRIRVDGPHEDGDEAFVLGNRDMLLRALTNLLDNAIKYSDEGTVVDVWITSDERHVSIAVADNGIGIPAEAMPRLFEPFFQVDGTYRDASGGVGLGLPFVRTVVERHGGSIDVTSAPRQGSRFTVHLPMTRAGTDDAA